MKKLLIFLLTFLLVAQLVHAFDYDKLQGVEIPQDIKGLIGNQKVNVFIDNEFSFSFEIKEAKILASDAQIEKASLEVYLSNETLNKIESSQDKPGSVLESYKSGEIKIIKKTFMNKIKFFFARFFI